MRVLGVYGGIGSMMIGAKEQGCEIIGNIEDREYFFTGTFERNFPGSFMVHSVDELSEEQIKQCTGVDLIIGHPKCGSFSTMRHHNGTLEDARKELAGNFSKFISAIRQFQPKFFAIDNLPKALTEFNWKDWHDQLSDYDITFEYISNYNYGNVQKGRKRLFVIGAKKELGFYFIPNEKPNTETLIQRLRKITTDANNQQWKSTDIVEGWRKHEFEEQYIGLQGDTDKLTYAEFREYLKKQPVGKCIQCLNRKGEMTTRIGKSVIDVNKPAKTQSGGNTGHHYQFRNDTYMPFTIRERAKIQGCPDWFEFVPNKAPEINKWHNNLIHQTGKFMPYEFCSFLTKQIAAFLAGNRNENKYSAQRLISNDETIDQNKYEYCKSVGYTNQEKVCAFCGAADFCKKKEFAKRQLTLNLTD